MPAASKSVYPTELASHVAAAHRTQRKDPAMLSNFNSFETLESRRMLAADAFVTGGILRVDGSTSADQIVVKAVNRLIQVGGTTLRPIYDLAEQFLVQVTDNAGNFRNDPLGNAINRYFNRAGITRLEIYAAGGSDTVNSSQTSVASKVYGGSGNDVIATGGGADSVFGESGNDSATLNAGADSFSGGAGNDTAFGGSGNDSLSGGDNDDRLHGEAGNDSLNGGNGSDSLTGSTGNDTALAGDGNDTVEGGDGNDSLRGGGDNDSVYGNAGHDVLRGDTGNDYLSGSTGDDKLYGHTGTDSLYGGSGRDVLIGGQNNNADYLDGGSGQDRFIEWSSTSSGSYETRADVQSQDAVIFFRDSDEQTVTLGSNIGSTEFSAGSWTQSEIEAADAAFLVLQNKTGNTTLLKTNWGWELTFHRAGSPTTNVNKADTVGGWNSGWGSVTITEFAASQGSDNIQRVVVHEIGHNWDDESPFYNDWKALSGWEGHIPGVHDLFPPEGKVKSDDGNWWRDEDADFARTYGEMNPLEDWATMWEAYFGYNGTAVSAKVAHLDDFFDHIADLT
jgi:hypothetical protein